jgi:glycosyltransferase involved in cell wall biosynthesis
LLPEDAILSDTFLNELTAVGEVDILVGVPTANNAATVTHVLTALQIGLIKYFPRARSVLVNADAQSRDGTAEAVANAAIKDYSTLLTSSPLRTMHRLTTPYHPNLGKGGAWRIIVAAADLLRAKACAVLSADLESITPECVESLIRPVYRDGFDLVAPVYQRPKFSGLLIKNVVSPMVGGVYGRSLREPAGPEVGFSGRLASSLLNSSNWAEEAVRLAPELWATTTAIANRYKICQSFFGPKPAASKRTTPSLVDSIRQIVGALFRFTEIHEPFWTARKETEAVPSFGFGYTVSLEAVRVQRRQMLQTFQKGVAELDTIMGSILSPQTLAQLKAISASTDDHFTYPDELWVKTVYDFAAAYHHSVMNRDHLMQALAPLYQGRASGFVAESRAEPRALDQQLEQLSLQYEQALPYFMERWAAKS